MPIPYPAVVPFALYENYLEVLPEGLETSDVELIWWTAAATNSSDVLRNAIGRLIERRSDWGDFQFHPIADRQGNGRYPQALVLLVIEQLPQGVALSVEADECYSNGEPLEVQNSTIIQEVIWHQITFELLRLCPKEGLPEHLLELALCLDVGV